MYIIQKGAVRAALEEQACSAPLLIAITPSRWKLLSDGKKAQQRWQQEESTTAEANNQST